MDDFLIILLAFFVFSISLLNFRKEQFVAFKTDGCDFPPYPGEFLGPLTKASYPVTYVRVSGYYYSKTPTFYRGGRAIIPLISMPDDTNMTNFYALYSPDAETGESPTSRHNTLGPPSSSIKSESPFLPSLRTVSGGWILETSERIKPEVYITDHPLKPEHRLKVESAGENFGRYYWRFEL